MTAVTPLRNVLVIAYSFPPVAVRSQRVVKFVRYLSRFGWWPVVLTPRRPYAPQMDADLATEVARYPVTICRTASLEPVRVIDRLKRTSAVRAGPRSRLFRLARWVRANCIIPDYRIGWVPCAVVAGWRLTRSQRIDAIFVTVEPYSSLVAAVVLKRLTGLPLLVDFRDAWTGWAKYRDPEKLRGTIAFERWLERRLVTAADVVITVTPALRDELRRLHRRVSERIVCIPNGWDPADFAGPVPPRWDGPVTITYAGTLYRSRFPDALLSALRDVLEARPELSRCVRVQFVGSTSDDVAHELRAFPHPGVIDCRGEVSAAEARRLMRASDLLVLREEADPRVAREAIPSKLYEYIGSGRFILALAGSGPIRDTIEQARAGIAVEPEDVARIREIILDAIDGKLDVANEHDGDERWQFSCLPRTAALAECLDGVSRRTAPAGQPLPSL
jgi:glycosyltransferase involved in cell wall biosynthesis